MKNTAMAAVCILLAACGSEQSTAGQTAGASPVPGVAGAPAASADAQVALGLTERQLLDADLVDANGNDIGDVEGVIRDASGTVTHLLVEVEDSSPDRYVHVSLEGLSAFDNRGDRDIRTSMTRDQLMALPEVRR
ncbi:hypothetical protein [Porphyrobacter sp. GA68]|uniref:hypothetical protein n=1 Tax=Porphyrobacter sp. GA68 TaxID=2883480 RepID=UPI001D18C4B1|nr:hypothetical protein [Porphyrobacter sp. GA68]